MQYNNTSVSNQARTANDTLQTSLRTAMLRMRLAECGFKAVGTPAFPVATSRLVQEYTATAQGCLLTAQVKKAGAQV